MSLAFFKNSCNMCLSIDHMVNSMYDKLKNKGGNLYKILRGGNYNGSCYICFQG